MKALLTLFAALLVTGCAHWQSGPEAPFVRWKCASPDSIAWRYTDSKRQAIDLKVGDSATVHQLRREPATYGAFYSDGVLAFHDKGSDALVYRVADDELLAHGCRASLINL